MRLDELRNLIDSVDDGTAADPAVSALLGTPSGPDQLGLAIGEGRGAGDYRLIVLLDRADGDRLDTASAMQEAARGDATFLVTGRFGLDTAPVTRLAARPLRPGVSIGLVGHGHAGTLGAFVRLNNGSVALLGNAHVLSPRADGRPGGEVIQPGGYDGGTAPVATVAVAAPVEPGVVLPIDAAAAALHDGVEHDLSVALVGAPFSEVAAAQIGTRVAKVGRTTGLTRGTVIGVEGRVWMNYPSGRVRLRNLVLTRGDDRFSLPGDSGAVLFREEDSAAVALHVGSNVEEDEPAVVYALSHQLHDVLNRLDATLL
jgi:hypothetical protein